MADRYWVGGSGNWPGSTTANWSATSGGPSGASVPGSADHAIFNAASSAGSYTLTINGGTTLGQLTMNGPATGTLTWTGAGFTTSTLGNVVVGANVVITANTTFSTNNTVPITLDVLPTVGWYVDILGTGSVTLLRNLTFNSLFRKINTGVFNLNNFTLTNISTSTISWFQGTINFGTGKIVASAGNITVGSAGNLAVTYTGTGGFEMLGTGTFTLAGTPALSVPLTIPASAPDNINITLTSTTTAKSISVLNFASPTTSQQRRLTITSNNFIVNNLNLGTPGATPNCRIFCRSGTQVTPYTITNPTSATLVNVDFWGIGLSVARSGTSLGGCGATANITFTTAKTVYWSLLAGGSWAQNAFATSSGGAPALANWPLPQDTVIFDNAGLNTGATITNNAAFFAMPGMNASTRSNAMTLTIGGANFLVKMCGTIYNFSSAVTFTAPLYANGLGYTNTVSNFTYLNSTTPAPEIQQDLGSNITLGASSFANGLTLLNGTFNLNNFTLTLSNVLNYNTQTTTRTLAFGTSGVINITRTSGVVLTGDVINFTVTGTGARNVNLTGASTSGQTRTTLSTGGISEANSFNLNITNGAVGSLMAFTGTNNFQNLNFTGYSGGFTAAYTLTAFGNVTLSSTMTVASTSIFIFAKTSGTQTYTANGRSFNGTLNKSSAGILTLNDAAFFDQVTFSAGTIQLNNFTHTLNAFNFGGAASSNAATLDWGSVGSTITLSFGGSSFANTRTNQASVTWTGAGTKTINFTSTATSGTRTCFPGTNLNESTAPNVNFTGAPASGSSSVTLTNALGTTHYKSLTFPVGGLYTWNSVTGSPSAIFYGNLTLTSSVILNYNGNVTFSNTSGTAVFLSAGKIFTGVLGRSGVGGTTQLASAATTTNINGFFVTSGTWDLNGFTLTATIFASSGTATRSLAFGTGSLNLNTTTIATVINIPNGGTGFSVSGTPTVNVTGGAGSGFTRTITIVGTPEAASLNVNVTGGFSGSIVAIGGSVFRSLSFIGSNSIPSGTLAITMYGSLTIPTVGGGWSSTGTMTWANTSGTAVVTSNLNPMNCAMVMDGPGGTLQLAGSLNLSTGGGVNTFTLTRGTLNLNNLPLSCRGFLSNNSNTRVLALGTGNVSIFQSASSPTTIWNTSTSTNLTITGTTCSININAQLTSTTLTFAGGGATFPGVVRFINFGASGTPPVFIISGNNTFSTLGSDNFSGSYLRTLSLTSGTTQTVTTFAYVGASGSLSTLNSTTAGSQATLSKASGTVTASYLSIKDSNATGGATWDASNGTNTNAGNNTGWFFGAVAFLASAFLNFF
jgi:hypothetical protein